MKTLHTIYNNFAKRTAIILTLLLTLGVTSAWAAEELAYTITFSNSANGNTSISTSTKASTVIAEDSRTYVTASPFSNISKAYYGDTQTSIRLGTSSAQGELTIALSSEGKVAATKIVVSCGYWKSGESPTLSINGAIAQTISSSEQDLIFDIDDDITSLVLNTTTRAYVYSISVYTEAAPSTFTVTCQSNNSSYGTVSQASVTNVANNTSISAEGNILTVGTTTVTATPNAQDADYTYAFSEWTGIPAGGKVTADVTITANFTRTARALTNYRTTCSAQPSYSVTWDPNGGNWNGNTDSQVDFYEENESIIEPEAPIRNGYTFNRWDPEPADEMGTENLTYTAQWIAKTIIITWNQNYTGCPEATTSEYTYDGEEIAMPENPSRTEYKFNGWFTASSGGTQITDVGNTNKPADNTTYYAQWTEKTAPNISWSAPTCTVTIASPSNELPTLNNPNSLSPIEYSSSATEVATIDNQGRIILKSAGETTITAAFAETEDYKSAEVTYTLTVVESDNCRWIETDIEDIEYGDEVVVAMETATGTYALNSSGGTTSAPPATSVTVTNKEITSSIQEALMWSIEKDGNNLIFHPITEPNKNLYCNTAENNNRVRVGSSSNATINHKFIISGNQLQNSITSHYLGIYYSNGNAQDWRGYASSTQFAGQTLKFYKRVCLSEGQYWVKWMVAGQEYTAGDPTTFTDGTITAIPDTPADDAIGNCANKFMGWSESNLGSAEGQAAPTDLFTTLAEAQELTITEDKTFYAVFATAEGSSAPTQYTAGDEGSFVLAAKNGNKWYALPTNPTVTEGKITGLEITVTTTDGVDHVTTANASGYIWTIANAANGQTISDGSNYIYHNNGGASGTKLDYGTSVSYKWTITKENDGLSFKAIGGDNDNNRGMLVSGTTFGGYSLSNEGKSGYYRISVLPISDGVSYSNYVTNCCALAPATNLAVSGTTDKSATLTWTAPSPTTGITKLQVRDENGIVKVDDLAADATTATITELSECIEYTFCIASVGEDCEVVSNTITAQPFSGAKTVTFVYGNEQPNTTFTTDCDNQSTDLPTPTWTGYRFMGWFTAESGGTEIDDDPYTPTEDRPLFAHWEKEYTVTYDANGGSTTCANGNYIEGETVTLCTSTPSKTGYTFAGWTYAPEVTITNGQFPMPASNVTITAEFVARAVTNIEVATNTHRVLMQGSAFIGEQIRVTYDNGETELLEWSNSKLTFAGHNTNELGVQTVTVTYTGEGTAHTQYNIEVIDGVAITFWDDDYTETIKYEPGDLVDVDNKIGQNICSGWEFAGWSETKVANESNGFTPVRNFNATDAKVLYAVYVKTSTDWISAYNIDELHSGAKYVIVAHYADSKEYALTNTNNTNSSYLDGANLTTDCEQVREGDAYPYKDRYKLKVTPDENWKWQLENTGSGWTMRNISANKYLKINTDKTISLTTTADDKFTLSNGNSDSEITAKSNSDNYLSWYNSPKYWNGHTSGQQYYLTNETNFTSTPPCSPLSATFYGNGGIVTDGESSLENLPIEEPTRDAGIITPTASFADCNGKSWTFVGWAREEIDVTRVPVLTTDLLHDGGGNKHYYIQEDDEEFWAVYTNQGTPETKYGTITFTDDDVTKQYEDAKTITKSVTAMGDYDFELYHVSNASSLGIQFDHNSTPKGYIKNITSLGKINSISLNDFQIGNIDDVKVYVGNTSDAINILLTEADLQQTGNTYTYYPQKNYAYVKIEANGYCGITSISIDFGKGTQIWATTPDCNLYDLTWKLNGGQWSGGGTEDRVNKLSYGATITIPVDPSRTGYTFTGWSPAEIPATMPAENLEFTAQWTPTPYTVTWKLGGIEYATSTVSIENPLSTAPENPSDGELGCCADKFMGWSSQQSPSAGDIFTKDNIPSNVTTAKTYYAVFATAAQGVGTSIADFSEMGYENATAVTAPIVLGDGEGHVDATITLAKASSSSNAPTYYTDGEAVRVYAGGTIIIASSYHIKKVTFTFATGDGTNEITANSGTYVDGRWTENVESPTNNLNLTIGGSTGHRRIASITVTTGVAGSQYTNYVTQCTTLPNPALSGGSVPAIAVNCGDFSTLSNSQAIVFSTMQDLTCPVTFEVIEGDFLISTAKNKAAQYQSKVKVVPYKTGENLGKLKNVYVRANATDHNEDFTGTLKVTSDEIADDVIIYLTATVTCDKFTLTTVDHLGNETEFGTYFAGDVIDTEPTPSSDACTAGRTFDGWSTAAVEYGSLIYNKVSFPYTMPAENVTLIPVYRLLEDISEANYHRVTSDLGLGDVDGNNWAGDYLIAFSDQIFADGLLGGKGDADRAAIGKANVQAEDFSTAIVNDVVPADTCGNRYHVTLESVEGGYVLKTQDGKYNYYTTNSSNDISVSDNQSTAAKYALNVVFESKDDIRLSLSGNATGSVFRYGCSQGNCFFRFYKDCGGNPIYLYKKSPLYTSSLICEEITAEDAMVTSTAGQTVKVNVTATMSDMTVSRDRTLTVESDNEDFTATITPTATENEYNVAVSYTPSVEDITDDTETATITIKVNDNPVTTFQVTGRHLPENFVIAAKAGGEWVALTAKVSNGTQVAVPIIVDDKTAPTKAIVALNTCQYKLLGLTTKNRFDVNGTAVHLYSTQTEKVLNASTATGTKTYLNTDANQTNAETSPNALFYEWKLVSKDLVHYTITNSNQTAGWENNRILGYSAATGMWGMYSKGTNINQDLFLLPVETVLTEIDMEVMEWGENSIALRIPTDAPEKIQVTLGENTSEAKALTNLNADGSASDLYKVEGLTLNSNDCEVMMITDADNTTQGTLVRKPIIITGEVESTTYTSDDCPHCDVVVLKDAKLKAGSSHLDFAKIYVYPGGKLVLDGNSLGVKQQVYLRGGYSWLNQETYALPEVYLNGSINFNGSDNIIYDYYIQNYKYYQFALPYDVQLAKVTDEAGIDNFPVWVKHYNGALRAVDPHATSWEWYPSENGDANAYFKAGEGYIIAAQPRQVGNTANRPLSIIRFPLGNKVFNKTNGLETDRTITTTAHGINGYKAGTVTANNVGWNFIGNPFMSTWQGDIGYKQLTKHPNEANWDGTYDWVDADIKYITIMSAESGSDYAQYIASETELKPFFPFYLQETADGGDGTINFAAANRIQKAPAMLSAETPREAFVQIEITAEGNTDQTGMFIGDRYSDDIDFNDYEKMFGSSTDKPKVWLMHEDKRMAFEAMTESTAATYIPLGYRAPKTGKYMFAINEEASKLSDVEAVYLTDNQTGVTDFDLLSSAYEFESNGELYNDSRFTIRIVLRDESPGTTTGVGNLLHFNSEQPMKFFYQDKLYILRNGIIYDAMGKQVQTINK